LDSIVDGKLKRIDLELAECSDEELNKLKAMDFRLHLY
jgi:hypothetical protein